MRTPSSPWLASLLMLAPATAQARSDEDRFQASGAQYVATVHEALHLRWKTFTDLLHTLPAGNPLRDNSGLATTVELAVLPDGAIATVTRTAGSGQPGFDDAPADLLRDVKRLPPPPSALRSDDGRVYLRWHFDRAAEDSDRGVVIERKLPVRDAVKQLVAAGSADLAAERAGEEIAARPAEQGQILQLLADAVVRHDARSSDPALRSTAARALGHLDHPDVLLSALLRDPDRGVREQSFAAVGERALSRALLSQIVDSLRGDEAAAAASAIGRLGEHDLIAAADAAGARAALGQTLLGGRAAPECAAALHALHDDPAARATISTLLARPSARAAGARAALQLGDPALEPALLGAASSAGDRPLVMEALGHLGAAASPAARAAIWKAMRDDRAEVRVAATRAALALGDRRSRGRFVDGLADSDAAVRAASVSALVALCGDSAADELYRPMRDASPVVRAALAAALTSHPLASAQAIVRRLHSDEDAAVQAALSPAPAPPPSADPAQRLLHAAGDAERVRAAAEWLSAHAAAGARGPGRPVAVSSIAR